MSLSVGKRMVSRVRIHAADEGIDAASRTERVVHHILLAATAGRYIPGQRVTESELTRLLGVNRGCVREAFRRLDGLGVVAQQLHRGACIRALTRREAIDLVIAIEPTGRLIVRLAAERLHGGSVPKGLAELTRELRSFLNDENGLHQLPAQRQHLYDVLIGIGGNTQLSSVFPTMRLHLLRAQCVPFLTKVRLEKHRQGHVRIASAVLSGNAKAAEKAMIAHNRATQLALEAMPALAFPAETAE